MQEKPFCSFKQPNKSSRAMSLSQAFLSDQNAAFVAYVKTPYFTACRIKLFTIVM